MSAAQGKGRAGLANVPARAPWFSALDDREILARILDRAFADRFHRGRVTRWLELAQEVNAGNREVFPNEIAAALGEPPGDAKLKIPYRNANSRTRNEA